MVGIAGGRRTTQNSPHINEKHPAAVSSPASAGAYVYALSDWLVNQLFKDWKQMEDKSN
jgi:hypothetical protein